MCGIGGIINKNENVRNLSILENLGEGLKHRGRSSMGQYSDKDISIVCARHATIALQEGTQPITSTNTKIVLIGNGEIYNHLDLKSSMPQESSGNLSAGDLCVALALFEQEGVAAFKKLRGPFSLAFWDPENRKLWLARDVLGERPLYYYNATDFFIFASELRSIQKALVGKIDVDPSAALSFIGLGRPLRNETLLKGIASVQPGHVVCISLKNDLVIDSIPFTEFPSKRDNASLDNDYINTLITQANDRVLVTDHPVAIAFSGGVDSTVILDHARRNHDLAAVITIFSKDRKNDENLQRSQIIAKQLGLSLTEVGLSLPAPHALEDILINHLDGPAAEPVVMHNNALHAIASSFSPVLLGGHGADEVFAGYKRYAQILDVVRELPSESYTDFYQFIHSIPSLAWDRMKRLLQWEECSKLTSMASCEYVYDAHKDLNYQLLNFQGKHPVHISQYLDLINLHSYVNFRIPDENGLSHGVEVRSPYYDIDLINALFAIKPEERFALNNPKDILRQRLLGNISADVINRPKVGFDDFFDYPQWVCKYRKDLYEIILSSPMRDLQIIRPSILKHIFGSEEATRNNWRLAWRIFAFSVWLKRSY